MQAAQMLQAAALVTGLAILQKIAGFFRELAIARAFGVTGTTDAYLVGLTVAEVAGHVAGASLTGALVPALAAAAAGPDPTRAGRLARAAALRVAAAGAVAVALGLAAAPWYLRPLLAGRPPDWQALALACTRLALPGAALMALVAVVRAWLYAHGVFAVTPLGGVLSNLVMMTAALLLPGFGPLALAGASTAGQALTLALHGAAAAWALWRRLPPAGGHPPESAAGAPGTGALLLPLVAWSAAQQAAPVVERVLSAALAPGAVAALTFADHLRQFPLQTAMQAMAVIAYPALAAAAAAGDGARLRAVLGQGLRLALLLALPVTLGLYTLRRPIVRLVYEGGAFDAAAGERTAAILAGYAVSVSGLAVAMLCAYAFFSLGRPWLPVGAVLAGTAVQAAGGWLLMGRLGPAALAWAGAAGALLSAGAQLWLLHRRLAAGAGLGWLGGWGRPLLAAGAMGAACLAVAPVLEAMAGRGLGAAATLTAVAAAALLYAGLLGWLGVPEAALLARWLRRGRAA